MRISEALWRWRPSTGVVRLALFRGVLGATASGLRCWVKAWNWADSPSWPQGNRGPDPECISLRTLRLKQRSMTWFSRKDLSSGATPGTFAFCSADRARRWLPAAFRRRVVARVGLGWVRARPRRPRHPRAAREGVKMDDDLKAYLEEMKRQLRADIERVETSLLTEFHKWSSPLEIAR